MIMLLTSSLAVFCEASPLFASSKWARMFSDFARRKYQSSCTVRSAVLLVCSYSTERGAFFQGFTYYCNFLKRSSSIFPVQGMNKPNDLQFLPVTWMPIGGFFRTADFLWIKFTIVSFLSDKPTLIMNITNTSIKYCLRKWITKKCYLITNLRASFCFFIRSSSLKARDSLLDITRKVCCICLFFTLVPFVKGWIRYEIININKIHTTDIAKHLATFPENIFIAIARYIELKVIEIIHSKNVIMNLVIYS